MDLGETFKALGIAVALGLLVGLQRQRAGAPLAGFRTFPLVTVFGALCAMLSATVGGWILGGGLLSIAALVVMGNMAKWRAGNVDPGLTTEFALLVMYGVGAFIVLGPAAVALAVGGGVAVLLHLKPQLHELAKRIGDTDFKAIMQFVLITLVILPVLPDQTYGPFDVLNPHRIWLMVVLIVGISLGGYVAYKFFGGHVGAVMGGLMGGLISSTATTVSYARRTRETAAAAPTASFVIAVASAVVFGRVLVLMGVSAPQQFRAMAPPVMVMLGVMALVSAVVWLLTRRSVVEMPEHTNPSELRSALMFGGLFAVVLLAVAAAKTYLGTGGLYAVAALSGLTDMDAICLSTSQLVRDGELSSGTGSRLILTGSVANLVFKAAVAAALGNRAVALRVAGIFGIGILAGLLLIWLWPDASVVNTESRPAWNSSSVPVP